MSQNTQETALDQLLAWLNERRDAPEWTTLGMVAEKVRGMKAEQPAQGEAVAWRFIGQSGLRRFLTQRQYEAQTPGVQRWYEPFRCASCTAPPPIAIVRPH